MRILGQWLAESRESVSSDESERTLVLDSYRYLLRTAPPLAIERAHAEVFARLMPARRREILEILHRHGHDDWRQLSLEPRVLARATTRAELRQPGVLERALVPASSVAATNCPAAPQTQDERLFWAIARAFVATPIAQQFLGGIDYDGAVTEPHDDVEDELDYDEAEYDTAPFECFLDRNGVSQ